MVKYLSPSWKGWLLCLALLLTLSAASKVPVPTCSSPKTPLLDLPISINEVQSWNLNDIFSGYNLNITIPSSKPEFVFLRQKLTTLKQSKKSQPGLRNYHLNHEGNAWGNTLVTLSVFENKTILRWGVASAVDAIPVLNDEAVVSTDPNMHCYDAVWFRAEMIALVDCAKNTTLGLQNYFLYVNTSSKQLLPTVKNDLYVPFSNIYHRKIRLHTEDGYHYLFRAYFAEHVDQHFDDNTYLEIMSVNNPLKPWTIRVMDRSFLHQDKLSIMDFEVYLGDAYILDYHSGVIKFDITTSQTIVIAGRYRTDSGFTKLGVYSSNLGAECLLVLAHDHAIYELDWTDQIKPEIITKYSVPEGAWMHDLWVNEQYVVVQVTANLTDEKNSTVAYQSTYVFTRGSRTYLNAYIAIPHPNFHAFVDLQRDTNQLLAIDTDGLTIYQVSNPRLSIMPTSPDLKGKIFNFIVKAESKNEYNAVAPLVCTYSFKYTIVASDTLSIWPTGLSLPDTYYANYPGQLFIPLDRYVLGSNITYGVHSEAVEDPPTYFILQQNSTKISWWNKNDSMYKYTFIRTEQYDSTDESQIFVYTQDANNDTHFSKCITVQFTDEVHCVQTTYAPHLSMRILNLTANRFHYYGGQYIHLAAVLYEGFPNEVFVYDVERNAEQGAKPIIFPEGYEGKIQSVEFLGKYLVVVLRYVKEIVFFDMVQCWDHQDRQCQEAGRIDSRAMSSIGVKYFAPIDIYTSDFHPYVLFIQCIDRVVIIDVPQRGPHRLIKLAEIMSPATQEPGFYKWKMGIARGELILVNPPNTIEEHDLDELYTLRDAALTKVMPTFGYTIPDKFDLDFSDLGNLIYIQGIDPKLPASQNTVILVYRTGLPAVASFYDVFHLNQRYQDVHIDVTGTFSDYISVAFGSILSMFRQYEIPILVFEDSFGDYNFSVTYTNDDRFHYLNKSQVKMANYPEDIVINDTKLTSDYLTGQFDYSNSNKITTEFDDEPWFNGSVVNYTLLNCPECNQKLRVVNHVNEERVLLGVHDMEDYAFSFDGGFIQQFQSIIKMRHNGSIEQFVNLPSVLYGESCSNIEHHWIYDYTLSACKSGDEVYLYTTVYTPSKPFVNGPYYSAAKHVTSMHVMEELMIVVDVDERPWAFDREGGIIIYAMNHDPYEPEIFDQIEYLNTDDLSVANDWPGGDCFIGNAHFAFTNISNTYRLIISELRNGFFVVDFRWTRGRKSVEILKVEFINLKEQLVRIHLPLPNAAFFTALAINKQTYVTTFNYWLSEVIITTSNFHSFQVNMHIDKTGTVVSHDIVKIFYRYGFYQSENYIKTFDGYFAIGQRLPTLMETFPWYSRTVLTVYDTYEHWTFNATTGQSEPTTEPQYLQGTNIPVQYILGGYTFPKGKITFDWNFTFTRNASDPFRRIGLLALHNSSAMIRELSVHEKLLIVTENGISDTQEAVLRARNDFHKLDIPFKLYVAGSDSLPGWAIALIVIGSVAIAAIVGYVLFLKFVKGKRPNRESEITEKSLLEHEGEAEHDKESSSEEEEDQEEQEEQEEEEEGETKGYVPPTVAGSTDPTATVTSSVNRETISSVDQVEPQLPVEAEKPAESQPDA